MQPVTGARQTLEFAALHAIVWLTRVLPDAWQWRLAAAGGGLAFRLLGPMRRRTVANMRHVACNAREAWRLARASWRNYGRVLIGVVRLADVPNEELERLAASVPGWEHVERALAQGRGVIMISCHFGTWDLSGAVMATRYPLLAVVDHFSSAAMEELVTRIRIGKRLMLLPADRAVRPLLRALRQNQAIGLMVDRPQAAGGVPVRFFGATTRVPAGAGMLARASGAALIPAFSWRDEHWGFHGEIQEPIAYEVTADKERDAQEITQRIFCRLEAMIRRYPDQWFMFRDMWPRPLDGKL